MGGSGPPLWTDEGQPDPLTCLGGQAPESRTCFWPGALRGSPAPRPSQQGPRRSAFLGWTGEGGGPSSVAMGWERPRADLGGRLQDARSRLQSPPTVWKHFPKIETVTWWRGWGWTAGGWTSVFQSFLVLTEFYSTDGATGGLATGLLGPLRLSPWARMGGDSVLPGAGAPGPQGLQRWGAVGESTRGSWL